MVTALTIHYAQADLVSVLGSKMLRAAAEAADNLSSRPKTIATRDGLPLEIAKQAR